jgi:integrase/recombinase XerD
MGNRRLGTPLWKLSLEDFIRWVEDERAKGKSVRYLAKDLSHLRGLLNYAWRSGRADRNVLDGFELQDAKVRIEVKTLERTEAERLVKAFGRKTGSERRKRTMILLLYGCGLRTGELCSLDVGDVDREKQEVVVRFGKGGRSRTIPVPEGVWPELLAYLGDRDGKRGALFRTQAKKARIRSIDVCDVVAEGAKAAGLNDNVTPKTLRHAFATHLMDEGVDLAVISSLMGHRSPHETGVYLHALSGRREQAVGRLTPLADEETRR